MLEGTLLDLTEEERQQIVYHDAIRVHSRIESGGQTLRDKGRGNHHMNVMFTRHGVRAGVGQVNPHRFRHTFATWAIRASARELDVQYLLGHSSPMMVRRYSATYDSEQAAAAHAAFSPAMQLAGTSSAFTLHNRPGQTSS